MQYGQRYKFEFGPCIYEGEYIQTRGDDDNYPTFEIADGPRIGVHKDHVLGPVDDSCPVAGIERPALDTSECGPEGDVCQRDSNSGEVLHCGWHYTEWMERKDAIERFDFVIPRPELIVKLDLHDG